MRQSAARLRLPGLEPFVRVKISSRCRRISLRVDGATGSVILVLPSRRDLAAGMRFAEGEVAWIQRELSRLPDRIPFAAGNVIPFGGVDLVIRHRPQVCGGVWPDGEALVVGGTDSGLSRRLGDWLHDQARIATTAAVRDYAAAVGRAPGRISIRDPRSQWGSCSRTGNLSFSWRLILAPPDVLDYVAAHEVTHLVEFGHGAEFHHTLGRLCPAHCAAEAWLAGCGHKLHRYG